MFVDRRYDKRLFEAFIQANVQLRKQSQSEVTFHPCLEDVYMLFQRSSFDYFSYACVNNPEIFDFYEINYEFRHPALLLPHGRDMASKAFENNLRQYQEGDFTKVDAILYFLHFVRDSFDSRTFRFTVKDLRKLQVVIRQFDIEPLRELSVSIA